jgi:hypothetical protein
MDLHQFCDMGVLKEKLSIDVYDAVRLVLGLEKMQTAVTKGQQITESIRKNLGQ